MFYSKSTGGFYTPEINGAAIPEDAVEITHSQHQALLDGQAAGQIISADAAGIPILHSPPAPTLADMVAVYNAAVQKHLDDFAASWRYVSILSASSYANSTVPQFKAEAEALILWRDQTWSACYAILAAVEAGTTPMPASPADLIATLPAEPVRP